MSMELLHLVGVALLAAIAALLLNIACSVRAIANGSEQSRRELAKLAGLVSNIIGRIAGIAVMIWLAFKVIVLLAVG